MAGSCLMHKRVARNICAVVMTVAVSVAVVLNVQLPWWFLAVWILSLASIGYPVPLHVYERYKNHALKLKHGLKVRRGGGGKGEGG